MFGLPSTFWFILTGAFAIVTLLCIAGFLDDCNHKTYATYWFIATSTFTALTVATLAIGFKSPDKITVADVVKIDIDKKQMKQCIKEILDEMPANEGYDFIVRRNEK